MDKSLLIFIGIGLGALYLVINFMGDIEAEDDAYRNKTPNLEEKYAKYNSVDSVGQAILTLDGIDQKMQLSVWHASEVKQEFLELFPDYTEMKRFTKERTNSVVLQGIIYKVIKHVEGEFFSGRLTPDQAKQKLDSLKSI